MERGEELGELVVDGILVAGLVAGWWMKGWRRGGGWLGLLHGGFETAWRLVDGGGWVDGWRRVRWRAGGWRRVGWMARRADGEGRWIRIRWIVGGCRGVGWMARRAVEGVLVGRAGCMEGKMEAGGFKEGWMEGGWWMGVRAGYAACYSMSALLRGVMVGHQFCTLTCLKREMAA